MHMCCAKKVSNCCCMVIPCMLARIAEIGISFLWIAVCIVLNSHVYSISRVCFHLPHLCENQAFFSSWFPVGPLRLSPLTVSTIIILNDRLWNQYLSYTAYIQQQLPTYCIKLQLSRKGAVSVSVSHRNCIHEESSEAGHIGLSIYLLVLDLLYCKWMLLESVCLQLAWITRFSTS